MSFEYNESTMIFEAIQPILEWIKIHPTWAGIIVFLISLSESLAIVGLVVPGVVMMTAIGAMMGSGILPFWETLTWAILGAIAGDGISYWLGYHYHERLRLFWPFKQFPRLLARGENFFRNHGGKSIIFGRFVGPVRPMIPVIAGMMDMTPKRFLVFNILSAIAWAPLYSLPGILIGASLGTLPPEAARRVALFILVILLTLWLLYEFFLTVGHWSAKIVQQALKKTWASWQDSKRLSWMHTVLKTSLGTEEGQLGILFLFCISLFGFIIVLLDVLNETGFSYWNEPVYQVLRALYSDKVVDVFAWLTALGEPWILLPAVAVTGLWLLIKKHRVAFVCWAATIGVGFACMSFFKHWVQMPRPDGLVELSTRAIYSFPSGHVFTATLTYGFIAAILQNTLSPKYRWIPWAISLPLILIITFSRIYLGVHWFTDILGSLTLALVFLSLGIGLYRRLVKNPIPVKTIFIPTLISITFAMVLYTTFDYSKARTELVRQWPVSTFNTEQWWQGESATTGLYRVGAFKHIATPFDIQWLSPLSTIKSTLEKNGWKPLSKLTFNSGLLMLADNPSPTLFPVMPKFHRDRLPVLKLTKELGPGRRLVLQLWQSDFLSEHNIPLWVGTLRVEEAKHPIPLMTFFIESTFDQESFTPLITTLKQHLYVKYHIINDDNVVNHHILLIENQ